MNLHLIHAPLVGSGSTRFSYLVRSAYTDLLKEDGYEVDINSLNHWLNKAYHPQGVPTSYIAVPTYYSLIKDDYTMAPFEEHYQFSLTIYGGI